MEDSKLSELRNKIDAIDSELLAMLAARADLVLKVGKLKHETGCSGNFIRSGREARMLRELVAKGAGAFPRPAIRAMWRNIISASLGLEAGLKVALVKSDDFTQHKDIIEYFGSFTNYSEYKSDDDAIAAIDQYTVCVLNPESGWWLKLAEDKSLKIFARIGSQFAIAQVQPEESGADKTLAITHQDDHVGHRIAIHGKVKLVEIDGFHREIKDMVVVGNYGL